MQNNHLPTKTPMELADNSNMAYNIWKKENNFNVGLINNMMYFYPCFVM